MADDTTVIETVRRILEHEAMKVPSIMLDITDQILGVTREVVDQHDGSMPWIRGEVLVIAKGNPEKVLEQLLKIIPPATLRQLREIIPPEHMPEHMK
jgi:RNA-binding protein YhbY